MGNFRKKLLNSLVALALVLQMSGITALLPVQKALAAGTITFGSQFENQTLPTDPNTWTNGQLDNYSEGDFVNFRFQLTASASSGAGTMLIEYDRGTCNFFTDYFSVASVTPPIASVTKASQIVGAQFYTQLLNVNFSSAGTTTVIFTLQLSNTAGDCNGANTAVRLGVPDDKQNTQVDENGDFTNVGAKSLPMAAGNVLENPSLTISKSVQGGNALPSDFSFTVSPAINGLTTINIPVGQTSVTINEVNPDGVFTITENGPAGYTFSGGTGTSCTASAGSVGTSNGVMTATATALSSNPVNAICNFSNQQQTGSIKVVKDVINDNGGIKTYLDFTFKNNLGSAQTFSPTVSPDGQKVLTGLPVGSAFSITEVEENLNGYATTYSGTCSGTVTVAQQTCTITNNDVAPQLTVIKHVVSANGGNNVATDFDMQVTGVNAFYSHFAGSEAGTTINVPVGAYSVGESGPGGYSASLSNDCGGTIAIGQTKTCTITNTDIAPTLTVIKKVTNDDGGTLNANNFGLKIGNSALAFGAGTVNGSTTSYSSAIQANSNTSYTISEVDTAGYTEGTWSCTDQSIGQGLSVSVNLDEGENVTCEITNDDQAPFLIVLKSITGNNGGTLTPLDFPLFVDNTQVTHNVGTSTFDAGTYTISEIQQTGYLFTGVLGDCSYDEEEDLITIGLTIGNSYSCTIVNQEIAPKLTLRKTTNGVNNGGTAIPADWTLYATPAINQIGAVTLSGNGATGVTNADAKANVAYTLTESATPTGYTPGSWSCTDGSLVGNVLTLSLADNAICTINNDDNAPRLTLNKILSIDDGGEATESNWTLSATGPTTISGPGAAGSTDVQSGADFKAGTYTLAESTGPTGYSASGWTCSNNITVNANSQITLGLGDSTVCSVTNSDIAPSVTITKVVNNQYGGLLNTSSFPLTLGGFSGTSGTTYTSFDAGNYAVAETQADGYTLTDLSGNCYFDQNNGALIFINLSIGTSSTCTLTNSDIQPSLKVIKTVKNDYGGEADADDFTINVSGTNLSDNSFTGNATGTTVTLNAGSYEVTEPQYPGYETSYSPDCKGVAVIGIQKTCTVTNTEVQPTITLIKEVSNDNGGGADADDFTLLINDMEVSSGEKTSVNSNTSYEINEEKFEGYEFVSITGDEDCPEMLGGEVTLGSGQNLVCTITNDDIAPKLTLNKVVDNDNGGGETADQWTLYATNSNDEGTDLSGLGVDESGTDVVSDSKFEAGTYELSESDGPDGYEASSWDCGDANLDGNILNIGLDEEVTCTITNDDVAPVLTIEKIVINDNSGKLTADDFGIVVAGTSDPVFGAGTVDGDTTTYSSSSEVSSNTGYTISEGDKEGYNEGTWNCTNGDEGTGRQVEVTLDEGGEVTCTVTNNDIPNPSIRIEKDGPATAHEGDEVKYEISVTNDGDADLSNIDVEDDLIVEGLNLINDGNGNDILEKGETWTYEGFYIIPENQEENVINTAEVCADMYEQILYKVDVLDTQFVDGDYEHEYDTCDEDTHEVDVVHPAIDVVKAGPTSAKAGDTVTYTFTVTNAGDVALDNVTVVDSIVGNATYVSGDTNEDDILDLDETWIYTAQYVIPAGQTADVVNTVDACANEWFRRGEVDRIAIQELQIIEEEDPIYCSDDKHTLTIPITIVLGKTLSKTGAGTTMALMITGSILIAIAGLEFAKRRD